MPVRCISAIHEVAPHSGIPIGNKSIVEALFFNYLTVFSQFGGGGWISSSHYARDNFDKTFTSLCCLWGSFALGNAAVHESMKIAVSDVLLGMQISVSGAPRSF